MSGDVFDDVIGWRDGHIIAIDQTALPHRLSMLRITVVDGLIDAIVRLAVRGAPLLGVAGALGVALAVRQARREGWDDARLDAEVKRIADARPTAVNLRREVSRSRRASHGGAGVVEAAALAVRDAAVDVSLRLSERGAAFLIEGRGAGPLKVHTHCNTGALACLGWGSALGVIRALRDRGARARHRGRDPAAAARLAAHRLGARPARHRALPGGRRRGAVPHRARPRQRGGSGGRPGGGQRRRGQQDRHLLPRPRRPPGGHTVRGRRPESTVDEATATGAGIPIELRADDEVTSFAGVRAAPAGTRALNYAFDVTPADLVTAIVTEDRVIRP